jgi:hypothetical protein
MMILANLVSIFGSGSEYLKSEQVHRILDSFYAEILENSDGQFFSTLESVMQEIISGGEDILKWQTVISSLRNTALPIIGQEEDYVRADSIFQKAHLYISELALRVISSRKLNSEKRSLELNAFAQAMSITFDRKELEETVIKELPRLNIPGFTISLYEGTGNKTEDCRIFASCKDGIRIKIDEKEAVYPSRMLVPQSLLPGMKRYTIIAAPLYFRNEHLGLALMEAGPSEGIIYETALSQISGSLEGGNLVKKSREAELMLEKRNSDIETVVLPMIDTIKQVAGISAERMRFIREMSGKTEVSYSKIKETNNIIEKASLNINKILQIISIINEISTTVNLVALNASIEATHAGEFGTGFAIIAKEIKKLSDSTKKNSEEIARTLKEVVQNVQDSVTIGNDSLLSFEEQKTGVESIIQSLEVITKNMDTLSDGSKKILAVMGR